MQSEAVQATLKKLGEIRGEKHPEWESDEARVQVIMPCGTGKTRVGFHVAQKIASKDGLVIIMAPSIGLVRQLQGDWRALAKDSNTKLDMLAVCSDNTAGAQFDEDDDANTIESDPTIDRGFVRTHELTGKVCQSAEDVAEWLNTRHEREGMSVIVSTYQSGHHTGEGLSLAGARADLMIADEAHRTSAIRKVTGRKKRERLRQFTACHDNNLFPAKNRLYMTATPRTFNIEEKPGTRKEEYTIAPMHKEAVFGPVAYRLSYVKAVEKGLLTDYRIVSVALPDSAYDTANEMAERQQQRDRDSKDSSTSLALRKLAYGLALAGGVPARLDSDGDKSTIIPLTSSIAFLNRVQSSNDMKEELDDDLAREWIRAHLGRLAPPVNPKEFFLEHRDASHDTAAREEALTMLAQATTENPAGVTNVGIFGEGIDTPSLSGVAFIEARRSPIDVIQAVGRAMRLSPDKQYGIILVPIVIPPGRDAEAWLESRPNSDGWKELGQILQALRAHDGRIEDRLSELLEIYVLDGPDNEEGTDLITIKDKNGTETYLWSGPKGEIEDVLDPTWGKKNESAKKRLNNIGVLEPVAETEYLPNPTRACYGIDDRQLANRRFMSIDVEDQWNQENGKYPTAAPAGKAKEILDMLSRAGSPKDRKSPLRKPRRRKNRNTEEPRQHGFRLLRDLGADEGAGERIRITLLEKSGLVSGAERDVNILRHTVEYAAQRLRDDGLEDGLKSQLGMSNLKAPKSGHRADACTVTALLLLTSSIVHGRLDAAGALRGRRIPSLPEAGATPEKLMEAWDGILDIDYKPIFREARNLLRYVTREERKTAGLNEAVRKIVADAQEIGETYAQMEMDHAGELFNKVMGDQAADGAYFTRPHAAVLLAGLAIEALDESRWDREDTWSRADVFDPTCGSATLLTAYLAAAKRKARQAGATPGQVQALHRYGVEKMLMGLDINPVSLQLAGAQLTLGDAAVRYKDVNLDTLEYGYLEDKSRVAAGSLELLTDSRVVGSFDVADRTGQPELLLHHEASGKAESLALTENKPVKRDDLSDVIESLKGRRVALMNPPFVTRDKLGEKFDETEQKALRERIDGIQTLLERTDPGMQGITDKTTARPLWVALGLKAIDQEEGILATVIPTIALLSPSGLTERRILARDLHIRWIVTSHEIGNLNMSQAGSVGINESLIIGTRKSRGEDKPTKFISLDRQPRNRSEAEEVIDAISRGETIPWGHEMLVSARRMQDGDWSAAGWRSPTLDEAVQRIRAWAGIKAIKEISGVTLHAPGHGALVKPEEDEKGDMWIINSKARDAQRHLEGKLDSHLVIKAARNKENQSERAHYVQQRIKEWDKVKGHLLISAGQDTQTARVAALATETPVLGMRWKPVQGIPYQTAKAWCLWLNSTPGRLLTACHRGGIRLSFPTFVPDGLSNILVPDLDNKKLISALAKEWEKTRGKEVSQYREGYSALRRKWDIVIEKNITEVEEGEIQQWGEVLAREPWVCGHNDNL